MKADLPANESARLGALREYQILDTLPEAAYDDITRLASQICDTPIALVSLVDSDRQWFKSKIGLDVSQTSRDVAFCAHAIHQADLLIVPDARNDDRFADNPLVLDGPQIRFYAGAPLVTSTGEALGTLCIIDKVPRTLNERQTTALRALSRQVMAQLELRRLVSEQARYQRELEESNSRLSAASVTDDVSGFHNTRFLHQYLDSFLGGEGQSGRPLSLVFFDMDGFKAVVDRYGHLLGAKCLREVAQVVDRQLERDDRIVRYGGDEFVVLLPAQDKAQALPKVEALRRAIGAFSFLQEESLDVRLTASFGLATFPEDARDKRELLARADGCLFQSKETGKNRITLSAAPQLS